MMIRVEYLSDGLPRTVGVNPVHIVSVGQIYDGTWRLVTVCGSWYPLTEDEGKRVLARLRELDE